MVFEVEELKEKVEEHEKRIRKLEALFEDKEVDSKKKESIKEFIISKNPKNDVQKTLAIGYYIEKYGDTSDFNANDILKGFKDAKEKAPSRKKIYDKIASNINKGHMMVSDENKGKSKAWILTNSGEKFVQNGFKEIQE
jgi:hypothetical protein